MKLPVSNFQVAEWRAYKFSETFWGAFFSLYFRFTFRFRIKNLSGRFRSAEVPPRTNC